MKALTSVVNIYINIHMMTNLSTITKSEHLGNGKGSISTQKDKPETTIHQDKHSCKQACCSYYICLNSLVMTYQVSLYTMQCCELYMVSQTENCELFAILWTHSSYPRVLCQESVAKIVQNLLCNSSRIHSRRCVVPHPWRGSTHLTFHGGALTSYIYISYFHDDVIKWKYFPRYWPLMCEIHRSPVNSHHKGQWRWALVFSLICAWTNGWVYSEKARVCAKWQWNARDCVTGLHDRRSRECNPVTPVEGVSLSFRTHPCVLALSHTYCVQTELRWRLSK